MNSRTMTCRACAGVAVSSNDGRVPPVASKAIPVLRDVISPAACLTDETAMLSPDQRAALEAEARVILEDLVAECLPELEDRLRERLKARIVVLLGG